MAHNSNINSNLNQDEITQRVIYALLRPVTKLSNHFKISLKEVIRLVEMAYFHELRSQGLTLKEASQNLAVSQRKAVRLAKQLRENFIQPELEHNLPRRIEFLLWASPMSLTRIQQVLPNEAPEHVEAAVNELLDKGRIEAQPQTNRFKPLKSLRQLPRDTWMQRIGGLNSFVDNMAGATFGRFFKHDERTFARTLSFSIPKGSHAELESWYKTSILSKVIEMNDAAEQVEAKDSYQLSLCWAPYEFINHQSGEAS